MASPGKVDTTGPSVSSVDVPAPSITETSADVHRVTVAAEPATMKVQYGTTSGVYTSTVNNTVLNADKTVTLGSLSAGTTYYYQVTSYDAYANPTVSAEGSFTTAVPPCDGKPALSITAKYAYWANWTDYTNRQLSVRYQVNNSGATNAGNVQITGATGTAGVTLTAGQTPVSLGSIAAGGNVKTTLVYTVPVGVAKFYTTISASAEDNCLNTYTYPV
jgi:hypothetical protein